MYLIRRVAYADVEIWQVRFNHVPQHDLKASLLWFSLHTFGEFGGHSGIQLDRYDFFCLFQYLHSQVPCTGTNFKHYLSEIVSLEGFLLIVGV